MEKMANVLRRSLLKDEGAGQGLNDQGKVV